MSLLMAVNPAKIRFLLLVTILDQRCVMADWNGEYISPYAEHGKKSEQVKRSLEIYPTKLFTNGLTGSSETAPFCMKRW